MTDPVLELTEDAFLGGQLRCKPAKWDIAPVTMRCCWRRRRQPVGRPRGRSRRRRRRRGPRGCPVRVTGIDRVLVEIDAALAGLARANADGNAIHVT